MKIILTRPDYHTHLITPALNLGYLSAYLKRAGFQAQIIDALNLSLSSESLVSLARDADLVGIYALSDFYPQVKDLTRRLKEKGLRVVIGGPHASCLPEETLQDTGADFVVIGEGEETLLDLALALRDSKSASDIRGLLVPGGALIRRPFISELDRIPFPDWAQIDPRKCRRAPHGAVVKNFPVAPVISSRGCPFACKFCASPQLWERKIRFRSAENVVDEIEYLVKDFGVKEIHFEDDNLTLKKEHIERICGLILKKNLKISWATPNGVRADTLDRGLIKLMKKSGCYFLVFGIESGSQAILDNIRKDTDLALIEKAVSLARQEGLITQGFFIFGLPGETKATVEETINFAKKIPLDRAQFLLLDVLPGSGLWNELEGKKFADWNRRSYQQVSWVPPTIGREELQKAPSRAFRSFFFRPRQLFNVIRFIKPDQLSFILRRISDFGIFSRENTIP